MLQALLLPISWVLSMCKLSCGGDSTFFHQASLVRKHQG